MLLNVEDEHKVLEDFLNKNLERYYKNVYMPSDSILGISMAIACDGERYKSYAMKNYDYGGGLIDGEGLLKNVKDMVNKTVDAIVLAKSYEKPEGGSIELRGVNLHWRTLPYVRINDTFSSRSLDIHFRLHVTHKRGK